MHICRLTEQLGCCMLSLQLLQIDLESAVLPVRIRMRRKAVKALVMHTKDSVRHLKDDDDEMLRGQI